MTANHDIAVAIRLLFCITASTSMNDFAIPFRTTCVEDPLPKILLHSEWIMENDQLFWRQTYLSGRVKKLLVCAGLFHSWSGRKLKECFARACGAQPRTHIDELTPEWPVQGAELARLKRALQQAVWLLMFHEKGPFEPKEDSV